MKLGVPLAFILLCTACASYPTKLVQPTTGLTQRLDQGIAQLTASIEGIDRRLLNHAEAPMSSENALAELMELDRAAWKIRREQWVAQLDHLTLARQMVNEAKELPQNRARFQDEWRRHAAAYIERLENLQRRRAAVEHDRVMMENKLIGQSLE